MSIVTKRLHLFDVVNSIIMLLLAAIIILPLFNVVASSVTSENELIRRGFVLIPQALDFSAYGFIFTGTSRIMNGYLITIFRAGVGTTLSLILMYFLSYGISLKQLPGRSAITLYIFFTMLFSGGIVPYYILIKSLKLMNNILVYVVPGLVSAWYVLLLRNFIMEIPQSLTEAAIIDGASEMQVVFRIVMPLSLPATATVGLFIIVGHWNSWWDAFLFVQDEKKHPIQMVLRNIIMASQILVDPKNVNSELLRRKTSPRAVQSATIIITTLPIIFVYPFLQKYFVKGLMVGSIKG